MKKIILTGCLAVTTLLVSNVSAQTFAEVEKPTDGTPFSIEMLISANQNGINWGAPALRARFFLNENWAIRGQLGIGDGSGAAMKRTDYFTENPDGTGGEGFVTMNKAAMNVQLGGEFHFIGTRKLSPYAALGLNIGIGNQKFVRENSNDTPGSTPYSYSEGYSGFSKGGYFVVGGFLGFGMDFYFVENVYLGLELGLGMNAEIGGKSKAEITYPVVGGSETVDVELPKKYSQTHLGTQATFRIGWRF